MKIRKISSLMAVAVLAGMTACSQNKKESADTIDTAAMAEVEPEIVDPRVWESPDYDLFDLVGPVKEVVISNKQTSGGGGGSTVTTVRFDEKGRLIEKIVKDGDDDYRDDAYRNVHWAISYDEDGTMNIRNVKHSNAKMKINRDSEGRIVSITDFAGRDVDEIRYTYNWNGNRITGNNARGFGSERIEKLSYSDGELHKSNIERDRAFAEGGLGEELQIGYNINDKDQYGNWIQRSLKVRAEMIGGHGMVDTENWTGTEKRHIEYYEFEPMDQKYAEQPELLKEKLESIKNKTSNQ